MSAVCSEFGVIRKTGQLLTSSIICSCPRHGEVDVFNFGLWSSVSVGVGLRAAKRLGIWLSSERLDQWVGEKGIDNSGDFCNEIGQVRRTVLEDDKV